MLLTPKRRKFRKRHNKAIRGKSHRGSRVVFGEFALKATTSNFVTNRQIEAARKVITRYIKKIGKLWIRVFPDTPMTKLGLEMPMGKGKGDVIGYSARVKKGRILFEISGVDRAFAKSVLKKVSYKLPVKTRFVEKGEIK